LELLWDINYGLEKTKINPIINRLNNLILYFNMTTKIQRKTMMDYLVDKLEGSEEIVKPMSKEMRGIDTNYILFGQDRINGILVLVDKKFTGTKFSELDFSIRYCEIENGEKKFDRYNYIFMKNGTDFFRSAAQNNRFKSDKGLSLKHLSNEDVNNLILMRPEEILSMDKNNGFVQYYQPSSPRLKEGVLTYSFANVELDYSHIENNNFKPQNKDSKRLFLANPARFDQGDLKFHDNSYVLPRDWN
jgi:hypothetical protein